MRGLILLPLTCCFACARPGQSAPEPAPGADMEAQPDSVANRKISDQAQDSLLLAVRHAAGAKVPLQCPMPVVVPDPRATVPMPVVPLRGASTMPVARPGCVNPLFRRDSVRR
jgi:hypothetical protein